MNNDVPEETKTSEIETKNEIYDSETDSDSDYIPETSQREAHTIDAKSSMK